MHKVLQIVKMTSHQITPADIFAAYPALKDFLHTQPLASLTTANLHPFVTEIVKPVAAAPFRLKESEFTGIHDAMKAGRRMEPEDKKIVLKCPLGDPAWQEFKKTRARTEGRIRVDRILEALDVLMKAGTPEPTVEELKEMIIKRHRLGHEYPLQPSRSVEDFITGPRSCPQTWLCYMESFGLIEIRSV